MTVSEANTPLLSASGHFDPPFRYGAGFRYRGAFESAGVFEHAFVFTGAGSEARA